MHTTAKTILGIAVAASAGALLAMLLAPEKGSRLITKFKRSAKDILNDFPLGKAFVSKTGDYHPGGGDHSEGEVTSELINMNQYETYTSKYEL